MSDLEFAIHEIRENNTEYTTAEDYFYGRIGEVFASPAIQRKISRSAQGFRANFAKKPVTAVLSRMKIAAVTVAPASDDDTAVKEAKDMTDILTNEVWKPNQMNLEMPLAIRGMLMCGDAYLLVWPADVDEDDREAQDSEGDGEKVDIFFESAKTMRIFYSEEDERTPIFAAKMWTEGQEKALKRCRVNLYYRDRIECYISRPGTDPDAVKTDSEFMRYIETPEMDQEDDNTPVDNPTASESLAAAQYAQWGTYQGAQYAGPGSMANSMVNVDADVDSNLMAQGGDSGDGGDWPIPNEYGVIPVFHLRTDRPYGVPLHYDAFGPQNAITKIVATQMSATEFHGFAQRYALMEQITDDMSATPDWDDVPVEGDEPGVAENLSQIEGGPGTIMTLHNTKSVGEWQAAQADNFITPLEWWIKALSSICDTPLQYVDPSGQLPSGISQAEARAPLVARTQELEDMADPTIEAALEFAMRILGHEGIKVQVRWAPPHLVSDLEGWQTVEAQQGAGVPVRESLISAGYDSEQVDAWMSTMEESDLKGRVDLVATIAAAAAQLGAAAQYGVVNPQDAMTFLTRLIKLDTPEEDQG